MHRRTPETILVKIGDIKIDRTHPVNDRLVRVYVDIEKGKIDLAITRIRNSMIYSGYFTRGDDGSVECVSDVQDEAVPNLEAAIRAGLRPTLDLHWNPHAPDGGGYACADDETVLAAYRKLQITFVPCRILRPKAKPAEEAAVWVKEKNGYITIAKSVPPAINSYASLLGDDSMDLKMAIEALAQGCEQVRHAVEKFHSDAGYDMHYHQMLSAVVRRHERALDSIFRLIELGRDEHAMGVFRMAYEAFLNFYLDWMSPQFFGPRMQLLAALRGASGSTEKENASAWQVLGNFPGLLENTNDKARLSPLGPAFHKALYPPLSLVVHQSYWHLQEESVSFDEAPSGSVLEKVQLIQYLDFLTAALLTRVGNEVGLEYLAEAGPVK